jgi:hypothetical protein
VAVAVLDRFVAPHAGEYRHGLLLHTALLAARRAAASTGNQRLLAGAVALVVPAVAADAARVGAGHRARPLIVAILATRRTGTAVVLAHRCLPRVLYSVPSSSG